MAVAEATPGAKTVIDGAGGAAVRADEGAVDAIAVFICTFVSLQAALCKIRPSQLSEPISGLSHADLASQMGPISQIPLPRAPSLAQQPARE